LLQNQFAEMSGNVLGR